MIKSIKCIFNIKASIGANKLIYYYKKIPLMGKLLRDNIYREVETKKSFAIVAVILINIWNLLKKFFYLAIFVFVPILLMLEANPSLNGQTLFLHIMFFLSFCLAPFINIDVLEPSMIKYICVRLMGITPGNYVLSTLWVKYLSFLLMFTPALMLCSVLLGAPYWWGILLGIAITAVRLVAVAFHLYVFLKTGLVLVKSYFICIPVILLSLILAYIPAVFSNLIIPPWYLMNIPFMAICFALGVVGVNYLVKYPNYKEAIELTTNSDNPHYNLKKIMSESRFADVKLKDNDFTKEKLSNINSTNEIGYEYLNKIFFSRHHRLLFKPVLFRVTIICFAILAGIITKFVSSKAGIEIANYILESLPVFVFVMYFCSSGEKINKALFYNCDISLLRYAFYRNKKVILQNFAIRLKAVASMNLLPALLIDIGIVFIILLNGVKIDFIQLLILLLSILCLSLFFSVHHLFMYYIFQPFTLELNVKNPFYQIVNTAVYMVCYICFETKTAPAIFSIILLLSTFSYIIIALLLVYKLSYKTFRVK